MRGRQEPNLFTDEQIRLGSDQRMVVRTGGANREPGGKEVEGQGVGGFSLMARLGLDR